VADALLRNWQCAVAGKQIRLITFRVFCVEYWLNNVMTDKVYWLLVLVI